MYYIHTFVPMLVLCCVHKVRIRYVHSNCYVISVNTNSMLFNESYQELFILALH